MTLAHGSGAALVLALAIALLSGSAILAGPAPARQAGPPDAPGFVRAPDLMVVTFHADWCGACRALNPQIEILRERLQEQPILFVKLDLTDERTRAQAELLASALHASEAFATYGRGTGYAVLLKPGEAAALGQLTTAQSADDMERTITQLLGR